MFARSGRLAVFLTFSIPVTLVAQGFSYAPSTGQYRVSSKTTGVQEAMGQTQEFDSSSEQLLTLTVARAHTDTLNLTVVLDSLAVVGPMGMTPPGLDQLIGVKVVAKLSPFGAVYSAEGPPDSVPNASQLTDEMSRILPRIRKPLTLGTTWSDTTTGTVKQNGLDINRQVVSSFTVLADTTIGGERSWKIGRESSSVMSGSGAPQGQPMTLEGTATGKGSIFISRGNVFVRSESADEVDLKIVIASSGMEIGVKQSASTTVQKVR